MENLVNTLKVGDLKLTSLYCTNEKDIISSHGTG